MSFTISRLIKAEQKIKNIKVFSSDSKWTQEKREKLGFSLSWKFTFSILKSVCMLTGWLAVTVSIWMLQRWISFIATNWNIALETVLGWCLGAIRIAKQAIVGALLRTTCITCFRRRKNKKNYVNVRALLIVYDCFQLMLFLFVLSINKMCF